MFEITISFLAFFITIFVIVIIHEYGHYIIARLFDVKVLNFSVGFGPKLISITNKNHTKFSLSLIPLGGYVKMLDEREGNVSQDEKHYAFNNKKAWQKLLIVIAGPLFNFILAFFAFYLMYLIGINVVRPVIQYVEPNSIAWSSDMVSDHEIVEIDNNKISSFEDLQVFLSNRIGTTENINIKTIKFIQNKNAYENTHKYDYSLDIKKWRADVNKEPLTRSLGLWIIPKDKFSLLVDDITTNNLENLNYNSELSMLQSGDIITKFGDKNFDNFTKFLTYIKDSPGKNVIIQILRNGEYKDFTIKIGSKNVQSDQSYVEQGFLGVVFRYPLYFSVHNYDLVSSVLRALDRTEKYISQSFYMIYKLFTGELGLETIRGPVMVAKAAGIQLQLGLSNFFNLIGIISIGLGVINLLPIPVLDGGHAIFHIYEIIFRKKASENTEKFAMYLGLLFIISIMALAFYNDIIYW